MDSLLSAPATAAQRQRDRLLGALIGLARATVNEPKTEDTDRIRKEICDDLFVLAEDWDSSLLSPIVRRAEELCKE